MTSTITVAGQGESSAVDMPGAVPGLHRVVGLIKRYELYQYDERPDDYVEPAVVVSSRPRKKSRSGASGRGYTVKAGDNLSKIAKRNHTTTKAIMNKNGLKNVNLKPGQKIKL
jgi:LysM repeat protein